MVAAVGARCAPTVRPLLHSALRVPNTNRRRNGTPARAAPVRSRKFAEAVAARQSQSPPLPWAAARALPLRAVQTRTQTLRSAAPPRHSMTRMRCRWQMRRYQRPYQHQHQHQHRHQRRTSHPAPHRPPTPRHGAGAPYRLDACDRAAAAPALLCSPLRLQLYSPIHHGHGGQARSPPCWPRRVPAARWPAAANTPASDATSSTCAEVSACGLTQTYRLPFTCAWRAVDGRRARCLTIRWFGRCPTHRRSALRR